MAPMKQNTNVRKVVKSMLESRLEMKRAASTTNVIDWSSAGVVSLVSTDIAQGDDIGNRTGDLIRPKKFTFRIVSASNTATQGFIGRVIIFQDSMANGSTPAVTDVLNTASNLSPLKPVHAQERRFHILRDFTFSCVNTANNQIVEIIKVIPMKGAIHFVGTAAAAASAGRNTLYVLFINDVTGAANQKTYAWSYELVYTDA